MILQTAGKYIVDFLIDDKDFDRISHITWGLYVNKNKNKSYVRGYQQENGKQKCIFLHRLLMGFPTEVDHINGDAMDNRMQNLRECTHSQNMWNAKIHKDSTSGVKGVSWDKVNKKWTATIYHEGHNTHLGRYSKKEDAGAAYRTAALKYRGEYARTE